MSPYPSESQCLPTPPSRCLSISLYVIMCPNPFESLCLPTPLSHYVSPPLRVTVPPHPSTSLYLPIPLIHSVSLPLRVTMSLSSSHSVSPSFFLSILGSRENQQGQQAQIHSFQSRDPACAVRTPAAPSFHCGFFLFQNFFSNTARVLLCNVSFCGNKGLFCGNTGLFCMCNIHVDGYTARVL